MNKRVRAIAFYLPQFHPVDANDKYWGKGFTEWTNVTKAKPLYKGHKQPHLPGDLGFYDLRLPDVREEQAKLAREAGIEGFCYWHYWFGGGERVLERIFNEIVESGKPDFPFCLGWANDSWTGRWYGADDEIIFEQKYPGEEDYRKHFECILPALKDKRYIEIDGKKVFVIYHPDYIPDLDEFIALWQRWAQEEGLKGFYFISNADHFSIENTNMDGFVDNAPLAHMYKFKLSWFDFLRKILIKRIYKVTFINYLMLRKKSPFLKEYEEYIEFYKTFKLDDKQFPVVVPNWDNTPRCGNMGFVLQNSTPELFRQLLKLAIAMVCETANKDKRVVFIKSWNEWAEGNYLEPDQEWGRKYLDVCKDEIFEHPQKS